MDSEKRIARFSRRIARLVLAVRRDGDRAAAARLEAVASEIAEQMRREGGRS